MILYSVASHFAPSNDPRKAGYELGYQRGEELVRSGVNADWQTGLLIDKERDRVGNESKEFQGGYEKGYEEGYNHELMSGFYRR